MSIDCGCCGQDLRLPPIDPRQWRALVLIASLTRREHGPNICKRDCRVCRAYERLGPLSELQSDPRVPRRQEDTKP
jgi:hypothetical protein